MKRIITIVAALIMTASLWAQSPKSMSYQAVIRDANNSLITSQDVGTQISILQGSLITGKVVYLETHTTTTNANGLLTLEIGNGTTIDDFSITNDFSSIDWSNGPFFIQIETDPTGGSNYTITRDQVEYKPVIKVFTRAYRNLEPMEWMVPIGMWSQWNRLVKQGHKGL